jgi:glycine dehydrogenase subunit 1
MSYLPHTPAERDQMLAAIGVESVDDLFANIPSELRSGPPNIPPGISEMEVLRLVNALADTNLDLEGVPSFLGGGAYNHYVPSVVGSITGRSEFYTSYTPYQPEVSQGTLQAIYEYQTMIAEVTGMDVSNASLYDFATAVVEATTIAINETHRSRIGIMRGVHPDARRVLETYLRAQGSELIELDEQWVADTVATSALIDQSYAAIVAQSPNFWGVIEPMADLVKAAHRAGALFISVNNPLSLGILAPPGEYGADIAVGCGQPFGIPLSYGGPYLGLIAVRAGLERRLPGRIAGATIDAEGRRGFVLTLQAREQHIRREKASSNICTNHALMALAAAVHLSLLGKVGLQETATLCLQKAHYAADRIAVLPGFSLASDAPFFNEFAIEAPVSAAEVNRFLLSRGLVGGVDLGQFDRERAQYLLLAFTELNPRSDIDNLVDTLAELQTNPNIGQSPQLQTAGSGGAA